MTLGHRSALRNPPTDLELQAYVDGELDWRMRATVEVVLKTDSAASEAIRRYQAQRNALHRLYDNVLWEPVPAFISELVR